MAKTTNPTKTAVKKPTTVKMQMSPNKASARKKMPALEESAPAPMSQEQREEMVRYAAYHIAEKDGFQRGREQDYWFQAQEQIDQLLNGIQSPDVEQH